MVDDDTLEGVPAAGSSDTDQLPVLACSTHPLAYAILGHDGTLAEQGRPPPFFSTRQCCLGSDAPTRRTETWLFWRGNPASYQCVSRRSATSRTPSESLRPDVSST
ncbi:hypothetical protein GCM10027613_05720 [Microlunatus endophyticus]